MLSARFVQSARIQKSVPKQPKDLQAAGGPMWCSDVPCFAEIISGALEATGSAKGSLGPTQAARPGHQFSLSPQTVLGALWVSVLRGKFMWSGTWDLADYCPCSEGDIWSMNLVCLAPLITEEAGQCLYEQCFTGKAEFYWLQGQPWIPLSNTVYHLPRVLSLGTGASEVSLQC